MDRKYIKIIIGLVLVICLILNISTVKKGKITKDEKMFKKEYERFNNKKNLSGVKYLVVSIPEKNGIIYTSQKEILNILKNGTGVIYFGYPESAWSRHVLESLFEAKQKEGIDNIYYYNAYSDRDEKTLSEDGSINELKEGTDFYYKVLEILGDKADSYQGLNDDSIKRLYFPTVLFVKNGKIVYSHVSTVPTHKDASKKLSNKQRLKLLSIYEKAMEKIK